MFLDEMPSFQAKASKVSKASFSLKGNSNFSGQSSFEVKSRFINNTEEGTGKSKGKVTPLALDDGFEKARPSKKSHYIDTSDIHRL